MATATSTSIGEQLGKLSQPIGKKEKTCEKHGLYISDGQRISIGKGREIWSQCPGCKTDAEHATIAEIARAAASTKEAELAAMLKATAIPQRFIGRTFDNYRVEGDDQARVVAVCRDFVDRFEHHSAKGNSLIFSGAVGTGKSHLAAAILQALLPGAVGAYVTVADLFRLVRDTWRPSSEKSESQVLAELAAIPLLVIDEVGVQRGNAEDHNLFFDVMDRRYRDRRSTILMTNEDIEGFQKVVGDRVFDRLRETSRWLSFNWQSGRAQARKDFQ